MPGTLCKKFPALDAETTTIAMASESAPMVPAQAYDEGVTRENAQVLPPTETITDLVVEEGTEDGDVYLLMIF